MVPKPKRATLVGALSFTSIFAGCADGPTSAFPPDPVFQVLVSDGLVVFTQNRVADVTMDALFEGTVAGDESGCLRLASSDGATVVWPLGYRAEVEGSSVEILDVDGVVVGRVGETFTISGGEVGALTEAMGFTDADRELAGACPGSYWIAGQVTG